MEEKVPLLSDGLSNYERRVLGRNYGDRYTTRGIRNTAVDEKPNWDTDHAANLGDLTSRSVFEPDLSTNGHNTLAGEDWFTFTLTAVRSVVVTVNPTGGNYLGVYRTAGGAMQFRRGEAAGNLAFTLIGPNGTTNVDVGDLNGSGYGATESLTLPALGSGTYQLRVYDAGPTNDPVDMVVQTYDLSIRVGEGLVPPRAIAGINKRVQINGRCYLMGQYYSRALEAGAKIVAYEWDVDGDFVADPVPSDVNIQGETYCIFDTTGTKHVRLRVQDSYGTWSDWDEIRVEVFN